MSWDLKVRTRAFQWLDEIEPNFDGVIPRGVLQKGFDLENQRIPLVAPNGIFIPKTCDYPLSITTVLNGPYPDRFEDAHRLSYRYRGSNPDHRDNVGLRRAMRDEVPLIYFFAVAEGRYQAIKPVYITSDDPDRLTFTAMADINGTFDSAVISKNIVDQERKTLQREYATAEVQRRLHQASFRERVLDAYRNHCAMCRLKHRELLDAAHIIADSHPEGHPEVSNGLSLCKIHHAAFDRRIIGVRPDFVIEVRPDVLIEKDGPMLKYGLQSLHGSLLTLPRKSDDYPSVRALERSYANFKSSH